MFIFRILDSLMTWTEQLTNAYLGRCSVVRQIKKKMNEHTG